MSETDAVIVFCFFLFNHYRAPRTAPTMIPITASITRTMTSTIMQMIHFSCREGRGERGSPIPRLPYTIQQKLSRSLGMRLGEGTS